MARKSRKNIPEAVPVHNDLFINTALYIILSVEDGKKRSNSIENQQLIIDDYISDKPEFKVYDTYIDNGLTGATFDRPSFQRMLSDIEAGYINCVIVKDLSRLGRNAIDTGYYIEQYFPKNKVWCRSAVLRILEEERYTGMYIMGKKHSAEVGSYKMIRNDESEWIKIPDHHTPIISKETVQQSKVR